MTRGRGPLARWAALALGLVLALAMAGCIIVSPRPTSATMSPTPSPAASPPDWNRLATSVVRVVQLNTRGQEVCSGSGTILDEAGTILTNFHVVELTETCPYDRLGIAVSDSVSSEPQVGYVAQVYAFDADLDLAVLKITATLTGAPVTRTWQAVALGDSDSLHLGDPLRLFGYPAIGGTTLTSTTGEVAGFSPAPGIDGNAWIKTDATMGGGISGGLATDAQGRIVGVPTRAGSGEGNIVDCRRVEDTNGDGQVDERDTCVPIGGFINSVRPINLALPLIGQAHTAAPFATSQLVTRPAAPAGQPVLGGLIFARSVDLDDQPIDEAPSFPSAIDRLCAFFDYSGMGGVQKLESAWTRDGALVPEAGIAFDWAHGDSGRTWLCTGVADDLPLEDGLWEVKLYLDAQPDAVLTRSVFVGAGHEVVQVTVRNRLGQDVCALYATPSAATTWEADRLGADRTLPAGQDVALSLPAGLYDVRGKDCAGNELTDLRKVDVQQGALVVLQ